MNPGRISPIAFFLIFIFGSLVGARSAQGAVGVSPDRLELTLPKNETATTKIFLQNLGAKEIKVRILVADPAAQPFVTILPADTLLPPQEIIPVEIKVRADKPIKTALEILPELTDTSGLQIASGIKIPLKVQIQKDASPNYFKFVIASLTALLTVLLVVWKQKRHG